MACHSIETILKTVLSCIIYHLKLPYPSSFRFPCFYNNNSYNISMSPFTSHPWMIRITNSTKRGKFCWDAFSCAVPTRLPLFKKRYHMRMNLVSLYSSYLFPIRYTYHLTRNLQSIFSFLLFHHRLTKTKAEIPCLNESLGMIVLHVSE